jgi:hypothetical protein
MPNIQYSILFLIRRALGIDSALELLKTAICDNKIVDSVLIKFIKPENRIPLITQDLLNSKVFLVCYKTNLESLIKAVIFYCKELIFNGIKIEICIQMLLIKALIKTKRIFNTAKLSQLSCY